jgi:hypothetical protein
MLNVTFRPVSLRGSIVAFVEQRVEGFENEGLVLLRCGLGHGSSPVAPFTDSSNRQETTTIQRFESAYQRGGLIEMKRLRIVFALQR